jgi:hypothetical protein
MGYHTAAEHTVFWGKIAFYVCESNNLVRIALGVEESDQSTEAAAHQKKGRKPEILHKTFHQLHDAINIQGLLATVGGIAATGKICADKAKWLKFWNIRDHHKIGLRAAEAVDVKDRRTSGRPIKVAKLIGLSSPAHGHFRNL